MSTLLLLVAAAFPTTGTREAALTQPAPQVASGAAAPEIAAPRALRPRWRPAKPAGARIAPGEDPTRVLLKLADDLGGRAVDGRLAASPAGHELAGLRSVLAAVRGARVEPLFTLERETLADLRARGQAAAGEELADLTQYFVLHLPPGARVLSTLDALLALPEVEEARAMPVRISTPGDLPPATNDYSWQQGFVAPHGFSQVQGFAGGDGSGVAICDVEGSWNLAGMFGDAQTHEDLLGLDAQTPAPAAWDSSSWLNPWGDTNHGTAVLGVLAGDVDSWGIDGLVPGADIRVSAAFTTAGWNVPDAILRAGMAVGAGGVVLVELQIGGPNAGTCAPNGQFGSLPMELLSGEFNAIRYLTALGVHVVEAAGNGNQDLDDTNGGVAGTPCVSAGDPLYAQLFDLRVRSSQAIIVGGGASGLVPNTTTNRGTRVDCFSSGENVTTLGYGDLANLGPDQMYTSIFAGTSSASTIVAGVAASLEGLHEGLYGGANLPPHAMRLLLRTSGGLSANPGADRIGRWARLLNQFRILETGPRPALIYETAIDSDRIGEAVAGVGDADGDGYGDVAIGGQTNQVVVLSGVTGTPIQTFTGSTGNFGKALAGAGDVDRDGYADILVGRALSGPNNAAIVYSGRDGSTLYTFAGGTSDSFGYSVDGAGDVDGDGYDDVIVGAPSQALTGTSGRVYVFSGRTGAAIYTIDGEVGYYNLGWDVAGAGDLDGDGTPDFVASATHQLPSAAQRKVYAYSGSDGSLLWSVTGDGQASFGKDVDGAGDANGDGYADVVVGAHLDDTPDTDRGRVRVYSGLDGSTLLTLDGPFGGVAAGYELGHAVAGVGDVNGNGNGDVAAGAPGMVLGGWRVGGAWIFDGADGSVIASYRGEIPPFAGDLMKFGYALAAAGDLDGNGSMDLVVGSPQFPDFTQDGRVYAYLTPAPGMDASGRLRAAGTPRTASAGRVSVRQ